MVSPATVITRATCMKQDVINCVIIIVLVFKILFRFLITQAGGGVNDPGHPTHVGAVLGDENGADLRELAQR